MILPAGILGNINDPYPVPYQNAPGFGAFINNAISAVIVVAGLAFLVYLIIGGIKYLTSGGDAKAAQSARETITNALLGLIIVSAAWFIAFVLGVVLGINFLHPTFVGP